MSDRPAALPLCVGLGLALGLACSAPSLQKKQLKESCSKNLDCTFGLECVEHACQFKSFGECEGEGIGPGGQPQCLSGYKCRDNRCTVQCASASDCKDGEVCKIGVCQKGGGQAAQCYDNRDCPFPETCYYGQCATRIESLRCHSDLDCQVGFRCINGRCS